MILERHKWMLRDVGSCFDSAPRWDGTFGCRLCRVQEKGERCFEKRDQERHLAAHRREKIVREHGPKQDHLELIG